MGTDINWCLEVKTQTGWVGVVSSLCTNAQAGTRNRRFFAELAGLGQNEPNNYPKPRGLPDDISALTAYFLNNIDDWYHTHSWCSLEYFIDAHDRTCRGFITSIANYTFHEIFGLHMWPFKEHEELRVVFAFDS